MYIGSVWRVQTAFIIFRKIGFFLVKGKRPNHHHLLLYYWLYRINISLRHRVAGALHTYGRGAINFYGDKFATIYRTHTTATDERGPTKKKNTVCAPYTQHSSRPQNHNRITCVCIGTGALHTFVCNQLFFFFLLFPTPLLCTFYSPSSNNIYQWALFDTSSTWRCVIFHILFNNFRETVLIVT